MKQKTLRVATRTLFVAGLISTCCVAVGCTSILPVVRQGVLAPVGRAQAIGRPEPKIAVRPPPGFIYSDTRAPLTIGFRNTPVGTKEGSSTTYSVGVPFFYGGSLRVAWGDGSIDSAKANGNIQEMHYAEYTRFTILWIFTKFTVHARGD